jgi:hypothetical protein
MSANVITNPFAGPLHCWRVLTPGAFICAPKVILMHAQPVFYDFEASGLTGFPVEVGWAWLDGDIVKSDSLLIAPADGWDVIGDWDLKAEGLHGISVGQLRNEGFSTVSVAQRLNFCLAGLTLYSDSPLDQKWMAQLFAAANITTRFKMGLMPAAEFIDDVRRRMALSKEMAGTIAESVGREFPHTHRARADALYWAELWTAFSRSDYTRQQNPGGGRSVNLALKP